MGDTLTWGREDKIRFGNCGKFEDDIVYFSIPGSCGIGHPEQDSHFVVNEPSLIKRYAGSLSLPSHGKDYAIHFTQSRVIKSRGELETLFWEINSDLVARNHPGRYYRIEQLVAEDIPQEGLELALADCDFAWNIVNRFVRWISKDDFSKYVKIAWQLYEKDPCEVDICTRWNTLSQIEQNAYCRKCALAIDLEPGKEKGENYQYCYHGASSQGFHDFFDYLAKFGEFRVLTNTYCGLDESSADGYKQVRDLLEQCGQDEVYIPESLPLEGGEELAANELDILRSELIRSRAILESSEVTAMQVYDQEDQMVSLDYGFYYFMKGISKGYRANLNQDRSAISVEYRGPNIFSIPEGAEEHCLIDGASITFYFSEVRRNRTGFTGVFQSGQEMELPPVIVDQLIETPFNGLDDEHLISRIECISVPAISKWGYYQTLFEKYAEVGKRFNIPIQFR